MSILDEALKVIGEKELIDRAIEEMAELTVAISHYRRGRCEANAVQEEIADVIIAMRQLEAIFGEFETEKVRESKIRKFNQEIASRKRNAIDSGIKVISQNEFVLKIDDELNHEITHYINDNKLFDAAPIIYAVANHFDKWYHKQIKKVAKHGTAQKNSQIILDDGTYIDLDPSMSLNPSFKTKEGERVCVYFIKE